MISDDEIWEAVYGKKYKQKMQHKAVFKPNVTNQSIASGQGMSVRKLNKVEAQEVLKSLRKRYFKERFKSYLCYSIFCLGVGMYSLAIIAGAALIVKLVLNSLSLGSILTYFDCLALTLLYFGMDVMRHLVRFPTSK